MLDLVTLNIRSGQKSPASHPKTCRPDDTAARTSPTLLAVVLLEDVFFSLWDAVFSLMYAVFNRVSVCNRVAVLYRVNPYLTVFSRI